MNKNSRPNYFLFTVPMTVIIAIFAVLFPNNFSKTLETLMVFFFTMFDWFIIWLPFAAILLIGYLAFHPKIGKYRLGGVDSVPEYRTFSWLSMLFTAGIGVGIVFFGPIEGVLEYLNSNLAQRAYFSPSEAQNAAMGITVWLWGIPAWGFYSIGGLIVAYFAYRHNTEFITSAAIEKAFSKKKWAKKVAIVSTTLIIIATAISIAASYTMSAQQVNAGINYLLGTNYDIKIYILIISSILIALFSILPISKGMKLLGDFTVYITIFILAIIFLFGPTRYFMMVIIENIGNVITSTVKYSFNLWIYEDRKWMVWYAIFYWVYWITWTPFVGTFLAKISKGRTIKEFLLASTLVPSGFLLVWFSVFSGYALLDTINGSGTIMKVASSPQYEGTVYQLLDLMPFSGFTKIVVVILFTAFVITTAVSGAISLGMMTSKDGITITKKNTLIWAIIMPCIGFAALVSGKIEGIKALGTFSGFPGMFFLLLCVAGLLKQLRKDFKNKGDE
jgi:choline-glycine betaine transporter